MNVDRLTSLWQPARFYLGGGLRCAWQFEAEQTLPWELFRGQLLDARQTRERRRFLTWNLLPVIDGAVVDEPLVSLLFDEQENAVFVTRGLRIRKWIPNDEAGGVDGYEAETWTRERVGGVYGRDADRCDIAAEIAGLIHRAIVGTSRLPLTSLEAPLPQFTLGQLGYVPATSARDGDGSRPRRTWRELLGAFPSQNNAVRGKILELAFRGAALDEVPELALAFATCQGGSAFLEAFRAMFNDISLSPYTDFVDRAMSAIVTLADRGEIAVHDAIDAIGGLLRLLSRHLTAYDLTIFHYRGANYPDALFLDALLRTLIRLIEKSPSDLLTQSSDARMRRRALRTACLVRVRYEGHLVPDAPTSPGEAARILPATFVTIPEAQIHEPHKRTRRLFTDASLEAILTPPVRDLLARAINDLADPTEAREGGMALFIDRPLGFFKAPAEVDQTPLLSNIAWSRRQATRTLHEGRALVDRLKLDVSGETWTEAASRIAEWQVTGLTLGCIPESPRPAVSLADARKVSDDFIICRTTASSRAAFWSALGEPAHPWPLVARIIGHDGHTIVAAHDESGVCRAEFDADWSHGSMLREGVEVPRAGLCWRDSSHPPRMGPV